MSVQPSISESGQLAEQRASLLSDPPRHEVEEIVDLARSPHVSRDQAVLLVEQFARVMKGNGAIEAMTAFREVQS